jgi:hypothetical protein
MNQTIRLYKYHLSTQEITTLREFVDRDCIVSAVIGGAQTISDYNIHLISRNKNRRLVWWRVNIARGWRYKWMHSRYLYLSLRQELVTKTETWYQI